MADAPTQPIYKGVTAYLTIKGAADAIEFYKKAFGAEEVTRMPAEDGKRLIHAHVRINNDDVLMSDEFDGEYSVLGDGAPRGVMMHLQVDDANVWWQRALAAGATVKMPIGVQFWGDLYGQVKDPFGHSWSIASTPKT